MLQRPTYYVLTVFFILVIGRAFHAQDFSVDPLSPEVPGIWSPATGIPFFGPYCCEIFSSSALGLFSTENVDAFSYGLDQVQPLGSNAIVYMTYSVDRQATGIPGLIVSGEVGGNGAAGDKFQVWIRGDGTVVSSPVLFSDAPLHGLTPLPGESDIDSLSLPLGRPRFPPWGRGVYFSIDPATAAAAGPRWMIPGATGAHIFYVAPPVGFSSPPVVPSVYATPAMLGLGPADDINAVAIRDEVIIGTLDASDLVYVALARAIGSPFSPADVIQVFPGPPSVIFGHTSLALLVDDDLDAITAFDPAVIFYDGFELGDSSAWSMISESKTQQGSR